MLWIKLAVSIWFVVFVAAILLGPIFEVYEDMEELIFCWLSAGCVATVLAVVWGAW